MTFRFTSVALDNWQDVEGYAVGHGIKIAELDGSEFCNFIWWLVTHNLEAKERDKFKARIWQPPKGEVPDARSPWSAENETGAFTALKQSLGVK